jgi:hypothetical protein
VPFGYESLIPSLTLPDPNDRHVLAAAIVGKCDVIVTQNLQDFPITVLEPVGIEAQHPDEFLANHLNLAPGIFCGAIRTIRKRLTSISPCFSFQYGSGEAIGTEGRVV